MKIEILSKAEKKSFIEQVSNLGVEKIPFTLVRTGRERIRAFSGDWNNEQIMDFWKVFAVEGIGLYLGKEIASQSGVKKSRLSVDGMHLLKEQITKNIVEINEQQAEDWFKGKDVQLTEEQSELSKNFQGFVAVKFQEDLIGSANISEDKKILFSFLPKERRVKENS